MSLYAEKSALMGAATLTPPHPQDQPALHQVIQRLGNIAVRMSDVNARQRAFIERTVGGKPEPVAESRDGQLAKERPAFLELSALIDVLEFRMNEAERLGQEVHRIA